MRNFATVTALAAALAFSAAPAASAAPPPPLDPIIIDGGGSHCDPEYPCDIRPITVAPDKTYPSRLVAWVKDRLP